MKEKEQNIGRIYPEKVSRRAFNSTDDTVETILAVLQPMQ
jgi:hypothetical protein